MLLCAGAVAAIVLPRELPRALGITSRPVDHMVWCFGFGVRVCGLGWLVLSAVLALVGLPVFAAGLGEYRQQRRNRLRRLQAGQLAVARVHKVERK